MHFYNLKIMFVKKTDIMTFDDWSCLWIIHQRNLWKKVIAYWNICIVCINLKTKILHELINEPRSICFSLAQLWRHVMIFESRPCRYLMPLHNLWNHPRKELLAHYDNYIFSINQIKLRTYVQGRGSQGHCVCVAYKRGGGGGQKRPNFAYVLYGWPFIA